MLGRLSIRRSSENFLRHIRVALRQTVCQSSAQPRCLAQNPLCASRPPSRSGPNREIRIEMSLWPGFPWDRATSVRTKAAESFQTPSEPSPPSPRWAGYARSFVPSHRLSPARPRAGSFPSASRRRGRSGRRIPIRPGARRPEPPATQPTRRPPASKLPTSAGPRTCPPPKPPTNPNLPPEPSDFVPTFRRGLSASRNKSAVPSVPPSVARTSRRCDPCPVRPSGPPF